MHEQCHRVPNDTHRTCTAHTGRRLFPMQVRRLLAALLLAMLLPVALCACEDSPVMRMVVSETAYADIDTLDHAGQPASLPAGRPVHASVHVIESPKGMGYTARWLLAGGQIRTQQQATQTEPAGVLVFPLDGALAEKGMLTVQVLFRETVLSIVEIPVK